MLSERSEIKRITMERRKKEYLAEKAAETEIKNCPLAKGVHCPDHFADVQAALARSGVGKS
jgi:hypothetical protein